MRSTRRSERSKTKSLKAELEDSVKSKCRLLRGQRRDKDQEEGEADEVAGGREVGAKVGRQEAEEEEREREDSRGERRAMHEGAFSRKRRQGVREATEKGTSGTSSSGMVQSKWTAVEAAEAAADPDTLLPPSPKKHRQQRSTRRTSQMGRQTAGQSGERRGVREKGEGAEGEEEGEGKEKGEGDGSGSGGGGGGEGGGGGREGGESEEEQEAELMEVTLTEGQWKHYPSLCAALPGRERQIQLLLTLIGEPTSAICPSLYVYGHTGTGKTVTLKTIMSVLKVPHAFINCTECYSARLLFETILNQLSGTSPSLTSGYGRCDNMATFIRLLQKVLDDCGHSDNTVYIVLDRAERLRDMEATLLPALLRLAELTHRKVCTVLVSELIWEKYYTDTGAVQPYLIHFPQYNKTEVLNIMCRDCPASEPLPFYKTFAHHIWNVFQSVCRDLGELRYLSSLLYPKYCEPVEAGEIGRHETRKLWRHIEPYFRGIMSKIYLREISSIQWEKAQSKVQGSDASAVASLAQGLSQTQHIVELPYFSKYLLIAAYLASYNPSKTDKKFFSKQKQTRSRRTKKPQKQKDKPNYQLLGPKAFPLDRLMAIFYSILEDSVTPSADIYSQISSLVTLQLISQLHTKDPLDGPKYKCLVTLEPIQQIARSVGFELLQYLSDFN